MKTEKRPQNTVEEPPVVVKALGCFSYAILGNVLVDGSAGDLGMSDPLNRLALRFGLSLLIVALAELVLLIRWRRQ